MHPQNITNPFTVRLASLEIAANDACVGCKPAPACQDIVTDMPRVPTDIWQPRVCATA